MLGQSGSSAWKVRAGTTRVEWTSMRVIYSLWWVRTLALRSPLCVARLAVPLKPATGVLSFLRFAYEEMIKYNVYGSTTVHYGEVATR
jgi:hypothetical protein